MSSDVESKLTVETIYGIWYMEYSERNRGSWFLHKSCGWGTGHLKARGSARILVFKENGEFEDTVHAPCGTGMHFWSGTWQWNEADKTLFIQIKKVGSGIYPDIEPTESYQKGVALYLKEETKGEILLLPLNRGIELERDTE